MLYIALQDAEIAATVTRYLEREGIPTAAREAATLALEDAAGEPLWCIRSLAQDRILACLSLPMPLTRLAPALRRLQTQPPHGADTPNVSNALLELHPGLLLDRHRGELRLQPGETHTLALTEREVALLEALHDAGQAGMAREALLEAVWGYHPEAQTRTLETHLHRLRRKLEALPERSRPALRTYRGIVSLQW